jgi:hypothetical protein
MTTSLPLDCYKALNGKCCTFAEAFLQTVVCDGAIGTWRKWASGAIGRQRILSGNPETGRFPITTDGVMGNYIGTVRFGNVVS